MSTRTNLQNNLYISVALVVVNLVLLNVLFDHVTGARLDLTEGNIYSLSDVTENLVGNLEEDVHITGYFSSNEKMHEKVRPLVAEVTDLLYEYAALSDKVHVDVVVPEDDEEVEQRVLSEYGLAPNTFAFRDQGERGVRSFYFGVVVQYAAGKPTSITFNDMVNQGSVFDEGQNFTLKNVEFELTRAIKKSVHGFDSQRDIFERFPHEVHVKTYISGGDDLPATFKDLPAHAKAVLDGMAENSKGKLTWEAVEIPKEDAGKAELEQRYGISPIPFLSGGAIYLWALIELDGKPANVMPLITADGALGEHDLRQMFEGYFKRRTKGILRTIGLAQMMRMPQDPRAMQMGQGPTGDFDILREVLGDSYNVTTLDLNTLTTVPEDVDLLLVMAPADIGERAVYAIDQYVMRGGSTIVCLDKHEIQPGPTGLGARAVATGMDDLLAHWGVKASDEMVFDADAGEFVFDRPVGPPQFGQRQRYRTVYLPWPAMPLLGRNQDGVNRDVGFLAAFEEMRLWMASAIEVEKKDGIKSTRLLSSSDRAWKVASTANVGPDWSAEPEKGFAIPEKKECESYDLAWLLEGGFPSYFADKPIPTEEKEDESSDDSEGSKPGEEGKEEKKKEEQDQESGRGAPLKKSVDGTRMIVIGDASWIGPREVTWSNRMGYPLGYFDPNAVVLRNMVDWMLEDTDLIKIRTRGRTLRPIDRLEDDERTSIIVWNFIVPLVLVVGLMVGFFIVRSNRQPLV